MSEQQPRVVCVGEVMVEMVRGGDGRFGIALRRRHLQQWRSISPAPASRSAFATALGDDPYSDAHPGAGGGGGRCDRPDAAGAAAACRGSAVIEADAAGKRRVLLLARRRAGARPVRTCRTGDASPRGCCKAKLVYFSGITLSLYSNIGARPLPRDRRDGAPAGRQDRVRRQFPSARLERRPRRAPARCSWRHSSASTSRCRPMTTKRCCGAIPVRRRRSTGCRRSASPRSW